MRGLGRAPERLVTEWVIHTLTACENVSSVWSRVRARVDTAKQCRSSGALPATGAQSSHALGATWALEGVWHTLGLDGLLRRLLAGTRRPERTERVLFALVAARAIEPASKLATAAWLSRRTHITGLTDGGGQQTGGVSEDECYRAMDWLIDSATQVEREVFWSVASLLDLEVDLLFFDTTSTYFEIEDADPPVARDARGHPVGEPKQPAADAGTEHDDTAGKDTAGKDTAGKDTAGDERGERSRAGFRTWGKSKDDLDPPGGRGRFAHPQLASRLDEADVVGRGRRGHG